MTAKPWWHSKTLWFNLLSALVAVLQLQEVVTLVPAQYGSALAALIAVCNVGLRLITSQALATREGV
jgi:hypothetical protein